MNLGQGKFSNRCNWDGYNTQAAARDAILYQTSDCKLRKKILADNLSYKDTILWGRAHEESGRKAKVVEETSNKDKVRMLEERLGRLESTDTENEKYGKGKKCQTCPRYSHPPGKRCAGKDSDKCFTFNQPGHFKGAPICKGPGKVVNQKKKKRPEKKVRKVETTDEENDSTADESDASVITTSRVLEVNAVEVRNLSPEEQKVDVEIRPRKKTEYQTVSWTADSGVRKSLISEADWSKVCGKKKIVLFKNTIKFIPYGTGVSLPIKGKAKGVLKCKNGKKVKTNVYVVKGEHESLLGKQDGMALGIIKINPNGGFNEDRIRQIGNVQKEPVVKGGIVSGGQTQEEIDACMEIIKEQFADIFEGIGEAKVPPIHVYIDKNAKPIAQKQRPIPINMMEPLKQKLDEFVAAGIIEGPLDSEHARGWVHNVVLTKKKWDAKAIRLNIDTRNMEAVVQKTHFPIPTAEQLRHEFAGSDRFTTLDLNHAFHQLRLDEASQDLFKFTTPFGLYRFKRLVMGAHTASAECHDKIKGIVKGISGVAQIKDDMVIHGKGKQHDERVVQTMQRLADNGITLRKEKCFFGQPEVKWFGHVFHKQGMSADPSKVEHIKNWPIPEDKAAVKSFLQTVQFCAPFMKMEKGETYADVTAPLRKLTAHATKYKWTDDCTKSFEKLKNALSSDYVLANYDPERKTTLWVDHGPQGIASTLTQEYEVPGFREVQHRPVYHNSRALTKAEQGYGKIDGESLAILSGVKSNSRFLYGTHFTVRTDHMPLLPLYNNFNRPATARVDRHRGKLRSFSFTVKHTSGKTMPCDFASRHPQPLNEYTREEMKSQGIEDEEDDACIQVGKLDCIVGRVSGAETSVDA